MIQSPPQVILWDYDGTLCLSQPAIIHSLQESFKHFQLTPPDVALIKTLIATGQPAIKTLKSLYQVYPVAQSIPTDQWLKTYRAIYRQHEAQHSTLADGVRIALQHCADLNITQCIVSNKNESSLLQGLEQFKIAHFFTHVLGDANGRPLKPDPTVFTKTLAPRFSTSTTYVMIGDTTSDLQFAQAAGIPAYWARYGYGNQDDCAHMPHIKAIDTLTVIPKLWPLKQPST